MKETIKTLVITREKQLEYWDIEKPTITPNEVLIETKALSLCTMEQRAYLNAPKNGYPTIIGHEVSGIIAEVGKDVRGYSIGDRVVTTFQYCGYCEYCKTGNGNQCENAYNQKTRLQNIPSHVGNAGMSQFAALPATQVCRIGDNVSFEHASLTEPLACCVRSVLKTRANFGDTAVVMGAGIMGILHTKLLRMRGTRVIVTDIDEQRCQKAIEAGANLVCNPNKNDLIQFVKEATNGKGADIVINTTSIPEVWHQALSIAGHLARIVAYASQNPPSSYPINFNEIHHTEIEIIGTVSPTAATFVLSSKLIEYGLIDISDVIEDIFTFDKAKEAYERAVKPGSYRCIITF